MARRHSTSSAEVNDYNADNDDDSHYNCSCDDKPGISSFLIEIEQSDRCSRVGGTDEGEKEVGVVGRNCKGLASCAD